MKKILTLALCAVCALCSFTAFAGCADGGGQSGGAGGNEVDNFPYWQTEITRKTDGQYFFDENGYKPQFPSSLWETPAAERYEELDRENIKAYFIESVQNTKVFCYVGIPEEASAQNKVPAVVCVHGATGTAFYDWVKMWNERGYAAIAMDTEGRMPAKTVSVYNFNYETDIYTSVKEHGPFNQAFGDVNKPVSEQWVYHAVSSIIASASFIKSFEEVDGDKLGITGVSYGGFLTCLAVGYDDRFVFGAPVYGCLANTQGRGELGQIMKQASAQKWDGLETLEATRSVMLFVNSNRDLHFSLDSTKLSARACAKSALCIKTDFSHGHYQGADVKEIFAFADEIFYGKKPLVRITDTSDFALGEVEIALAKGVNVSKATYCHSSSATLDSNTVWVEDKAEVAGNYVLFSPLDCTYQYIKLEDDSGRIIATAVFEK